MKKIYVCSLFVGDEAENAFQAACATKYVATECNAIPICPQIYFPAFGLYNDRSADYCKEASLELLRTCDELWYFGDGVTRDMVDAILLARELDIPVKHVADWTK